MTKGKVDRNHIIDACQALDLPLSYKYERNFGSGRDVKEIKDGASLKKLFSFSRQCKVPATADLTLMRWLVFNFFIANADAHGKNISYFVDSSGLSLAPFYDLVNISMYINFNQALAMEVGDTFDLDEVNVFQLVTMCENCGISQKLFSKQINLLGNKMLYELNQFDTDHLNLSKSELDFVDLILNDVEKRTKRFISMHPDVAKEKF